MSLYQGSLHHQLHGKRLEEKLRKIEQSNAEAAGDLLVLEFARDSLDLENAGDLEIMRAILSMAQRALR